jgi:diguanylate cyclase (GGDEF)-like protein/PAS domain S-box-containing protein
MSRGQSGPHYADEGAALAYFTNAKRSGFLIDAGPVFWVVSSGAMLIAAIALGVSLMIINFRDRALMATARELENTVQLLARHFDGQLEDFASIQKSVAAEIQNHVHTSKELKQLLSTEEFHRYLKTKVSEASDFAGVNIFDADGTYINSSEKWPVPPLNLSDRHYFQQLKSGATKRQVLVELVQSRVSTGRTVVVAQKISGPAGEFLGIVTRSVIPDVFENFFSSVVLEDGAINLLQEDGTMIARYPHVEAAVGQNFSSSILFTRKGPSGEYLTTHLISPVDGQERLASAGRLSLYPLTVVSSQPVSTALADWRQQTRVLLWAACATAGVISLMLWFVTRHLKTQHRRLDVAVNHMTQALLLFDSSERLVICNRRYLEIFGLSSDTIKPGRLLRDIVQYRKENGTFSGDVDAYCRMIKEARRVGKVSHNVARIPDGRWMQVVNQPLSEGGWVSTIEDVTEQRRSEERTIKLAHYDTLTDLPNRALFLKRLEEEISRCSDGSQLAVLFLDVDEFKSVNDSLGHHVGDELLRSMARSLQACLGMNEFVARLGGDEFSILASAVKSKEDVLALVQRIHEAIRQSHDCAGHHLTVDSSIGIAIAPADGISSDQILQNADLAMYEAKSSGRRTHRFFETGMEKKAKERRLLETELRKAIESEQIDVYYQPILDLHHNKIVGCEALARWNHAERGFVSPADFIPVAEQSGLIDDLGEYVLRKACREAAGWPGHIKLAVNVSPIQFKSGLLALKVVSALAETGLSARRLELEITEAVLIGDDEAALKILHELRAIGVRVALDDFGTGYSSLSYLQRFPFDKIKIDRSFVSSLTRERGSSGIVRAVVAMASEHKMITTAEGVETEEQRSMLRHLECDEMQGFLFSPARSADSIRELLRADATEGLVSVGASIG